MTWNEYCKGNANPDFGEFIAFYADFDLVRKISEEYVPGRGWVDSETLYQEDLQKQKVVDIPSDIC